MKPVVLICLLFLGYDVSLLRADSVVTLAQSPEVTGKLTLTPTTLQVATGSSPTEINLSDILEADFGDTPFQVDSFFGSGAGNQLPATWKAQDLGAVGKTGTAVTADGTFTLNGGGATLLPKMTRTADSLLFAGQPWAGDGQWTARLKEIDAKNPGTVAGLMLRDTLDPSSIMFSLEATTTGYSGLAFRAVAGKPPQETSVSMDLPIWLRLTRYGTNVFASTSSDGKAWDVVGLNYFKAQSNPWIGLFADSRDAKVLGNAVFDQVSFTPAPSSGQVLPPGVLLQSGTFLAGEFDHLVFDAANPDAPGLFRRNGQNVEIPSSKIAAVIMLPLARSQIAAMSSHTGLLMENGDVMDGDFSSIGRNEVLITSLLLGNTTYTRSEVRACFLHPLQPQPANYQIRLRDGSIVNATSLSVSEKEVVIGEASGLNINASLEEIAQFRAGPSQAQSLAELDWKATRFPAAPTANAAPVAPAAADQPPDVQCWEGPNQEQIIAAPVGTTLDFPLTGKFRAMGMRIALSSDSPPNSQAIIRVLADGREVARTPPFKAGDQPRFMEVTIQEPKTVTLQTISAFAGPKVLFIDPVAIRD